ncbi:hypothetical protein D3C81_1821250 [compost metagenome]
MAAFAKGVHKFRSDEARASDDDDLHDCSPLVDGNHCVGVERLPARAGQVLAPGLGLPWRALGFLSKATDGRPAPLPLTVQRLSSCRIILFSHNQLPGDARLAIQF